MAETPSYLVILVVVLVVLVGAGATGAYLYLHNRPASAPTTLVVQANDNVTVNYIGIFGSGPEQGKVFDTSLYSVAINNATYPKSLQYHGRGAAANYTPLAVHVGDNTPSAGYSYAGLSFIQVVTGFWQGLLGLPGNYTRLVSVPPSLGYGSQDPSCLRTLPLTVHVPIVERMRGTNFTAMYPGVLATTGASFNDPTYGWPVLILSANQSFVTIENLPPVGWTTDHGGWPITVTNITTTANGSGQITVRNELTSSDAGLTGGHVSNGLCSSQSNGQYIISAVNFANGTYTEDFNQEVRGQTLLFAVTVVNIYAPAPTLV
jgi:FKBP-type peptidyl-prolyl cis-trans isomerase 2